MVKAATPNTSFALQCPADRVFLLLDQEHGGVDMVLMHRCGQDRWRLDLHLAPGVYRFRYYAEEGRVTVYHPPTDPEESARLDGLDAILCVGDEGTAHVMRDGAREASRGLGASRPPAVSRGGQGWRD